MVFHITLLIFSVILSVLGDVHISEDDYKLLPPIFHIDDYDSCVQENKTVCRVQFKLTPSNIQHPSKFWNLIEETKKSKRFYDHDQLYYALCTEENSYNNLTDLKLLITKKYANRYKHKGLDVHVEDINCDNFQYKVNIFDITSLCFIVFYLLLVTIATYFHLKINQDDNSYRYIIMFSLKYNLRKVLTINQDFQNLTCIQGIRFYTTVLIIFCHTFCSFAGGYISSTKYLEDIPLNIIRHSIRNLFVFLVQTFFLISAWLLSYRTFTVFTNNRKISIFRYACLTFLNRYLRIIPPVLLMVSLGSSIWIHGTWSGPLKDLYSDKEYQRCQENWWITLLFLSNHYQQNNMCYFTTWYLSADTQLYGLSLVLLIIMIKFRRKKKLIMTLCLIIAIAIPMGISYFYNLDIIYRITPENSKNNMFLTFEFGATYTSTYSNGATYMLGLIFGYLYYRLENKPLFTSNLSIIFWWLASIGLPLAVIIISSYEYNRVTSAVLSGILRPTYALGVGIGIFGMSQRIGGVFKKLCEWKPVLILGNFTYTTYVVHFLIVFYRTATTTKLHQVSDYILFTSFLQDTVLSFLCGFFVYLVLEMPLSQLRCIFMSRFSLKPNAKKEK